MSEVGIKPYQCPKKECKRAERSLVRIKQHLILEHGFVLTCSEQEWKEMKGEEMSFGKATPDQIKSSWISYHHASKDDWLARLKDEMLGLDGRTITKRKPISTVKVTDSKIVNAKSMNKASLPVESFR